MRSNNCGLAPNDGLTKETIRTRKNAVMTAIENPYRFIVYPRPLMHDFPQYAIRGFPSRAQLVPTYWTKERRITVETLRSQRYTKVSWDQQLAAYKLRPL